MKKLLFILSISLVLFSCTEKKVAKRIILTTTSKEAAENYQEGMFRLDQMEYYEAQVNFKKALELDSNFSMAKIMYNLDNNPALNKKRLLDAYNNRGNLSEMESVIVTAAYEMTVNSDFAKADLMIDSLVKKYPDYYELYLVSADIKNQLNNSEGNLARLKEGLEVNPECYACAQFIPDVHSYNGGGWKVVNLLPVAKRNLEEAEKYYQLAAKIRPKAPATSRMYGNLYRSMGNLDKALEKYEESVTLNVEKTSLLLATYQMIGHVHLNKGEYEKAREYYKKYEVFMNEIQTKYGGELNVNERLALTYLYEKKYDEVIVDLNRLLTIIDAFPPSLNKLDKQMYIEEIKFATYGHSLREEEALASMNKMNNFLLEGQKLKIKNATNKNEINFIENGVKYETLKNDIFFNILFAHYEDAEKQLKQLETVATSLLTINPTAMDLFYEESGRLNLMEGKIKESIDYFTKSTGIDQHLYYYYFYALALKAQGDKVESDKIFTKITKDYFVNWQRAIVKELAKSQLNAGN